ncbi:MAG: hypothetical protein P8009_03115 [Gammaproteobacteria bacterium]|nr:hypothetical protein [Gammaproteobacteria bacterium]
MREWFFANLPHCLAALILFARLGDIGTTWLATPRFMLESNPFVRRAPRTVMILSLLLCLIPYWTPAGSLIILVPSLLVSANNAARLWVYRAVGEEQAFRSALQAAGQARVRPTLAILTLPPLFFAVLAGVLFLFYPEPTRDWGYWLAYGILAYALVLLVYGPLNFLRLRKLALAQGPGAAQG